MRKTVRQNITLPYSLHDMTKYSGYLMLPDRFNECSIEFYHEGDMVFVTEE